MAPPRPKGLSGITGEELVKSTSSETLNLSINDLLEERRRFEQYTREQNARLTRLRELINEEKASAAAELEKKRTEIAAGASGHLKAELEEARQVCLEQEKALAQAQAERSATQAEMQRLRAQAEQATAFRNQCSQAKAEAARMQTERDTAAGEAIRLRSECAASAAQLTQLRGQLAQSSGTEAELRRQLQAQQSALNESTSLRQKLQDLTQEHARCRPLIEAAAAVRKELDLARLEIESLRQREATRNVELERSRAEAAARAKTVEQLQSDIAVRARDLYRLAQAGADLC